MYMYCDMFFYAKPGDTLLSLAFWYPSFISIIIIHSINLIRYSFSCSQSSFAVDFSFCFLYLSVYVINLSIHSVHPPRKSAVYSLLSLAHSSILTVWSVHYVVQLYM